MYLCGAQNRLYVYVPPRCFWKGLAFFFAEGGGRWVRKVSNLKGLKRFPRGWRVGLSALKHRSTDDSFSLSLPYPSSPQTLLSIVALDPFSLLLSPFSVVTYCELLRGPRRPAEKDSALSLSMRKNFLRHEK